MKPAAARERVRCRLVTEEDIPAVIDLLSTGFRGRNRAVWVAGLRHMAERSIPDGTPRYGYCLEAGGKLVGIILLIASSRQVNGEPVYFRAYFVFGGVWLSWWNCFTDRYRLVTPTERESLGLAPLEDLIRRIAALTGMNFFSSEIAQTEPGEFVVIDYVNDQCHMLSQSAAPQIGVPDGLVAAIAMSLVEAVRSALRTPQVSIK